MNFKPKWLLVGLCSVLLMGHSCRTVSAEPARKQRGKTVLVFMDYVSSDDFFNARHPWIQKLAAEGAIGLMTLNTGGALNLPNEYLTIGSGARALAPPKAESFLHSWEPLNGEDSGEIYERNTGIAAQKGWIINPQIPSILRINQNKAYTIHPGSLGKTLKSEGISLAVLGNGDILDLKIRHAALTAMDERGVIPHGNISSDLLIINPDRPYGISTDYKRLESQAAQLLKQCDVLIVQLGDSFRAEEYKDQAMDFLGEKYRRMVLQETDQWIGKMMGSLDAGRDRLMLVSTSPGKKEIREGNRVAPIIFWGCGIEKGWISSPSTKREGIITNLDIAPTILEFYHVPIPYSMAGHSAFSIASGSHTPDQLVSLNEKLKVIYTQRPLLLKNYVALQIIIMALTTLWVSMKRRYSHYLQPVLLLMTILPLSLLLLPLFQGIHMELNILAIAAASLVILGILWIFFPSYQSRIAMLCTAQMLLILLDLARGAPWMKDSPLGYDVMGGARFYGIGNEYMGVLISCAVVGLMTWLDGADTGTYARYVIPVVWAIVLLFIGAPAIGTNLGGMITALVTFGLGSIFLLKGRMDIRTTGWIALTVPVFVVLLILVDSQRAVSSQTHFGQTFRLLNQEGWTGLLTIIVRKWSMNIKLIRYTIWSRVFLACLGTIAVLFYRPVGILKKVMEEKPRMRQGLIASTIGCITALLVNDSGIVAAALGMIYVVIPVLIFMIDRLKEIHVNHG